MTLEIPYWKKKSLTSASWASSHGRYNLRYRVEEKQGDVIAENNGAADYSK